MCRTRPLQLFSSKLMKVSSTYDQFPAPIHHQAYYPHIVDEQMQFGSYPMPMTPSDFGSDHDSPYCSPRPPPHAEPVFAPGHSATSTERTHTTSGVSCSIQTYKCSFNNIHSAEELKTALHNALSVSARRSTPVILKPSFQSCPTNTTGSKCRIQSSTPLTRSSGKPSSF